ncbi:hypothetical protein TTHERM_00264770 (macronuclear) [Tetrahymena thermophila SB210]|uniref:Uncharacterized protein n=1 Tax=Tetrahymena thermophila (strain SB210) TaxID=312017 RepID=Q22U05_TETTS|nr:hypothetical protein TTHERM_00264770 [Tetrahymena thermophila SB210]EAR88882.1 hypothetical protein TTHERM_00264770 [Tetrahymena thermophila SB210]|eukprot:XP_001009127.1 hypothetical protein TTHERM_00264770 [Tetrahymena thermophila SB210]
MNSLIKKTLILAAVAFIAYLTITNFQSTQNLKKEDIACEEGLYYCFSYCREYETCAQLQQDHDKNLAVNFPGQDTCRPPLHMCGDGMCHSGWCPS